MTDSAENPVKNMPTVNVPGPGRSHQIQFTGASVTRSRVNSRNRKIHTVDIPAAPPAFGYWQSTVNVTGGAIPQVLTHNLGLSTNPVGIVQAWSVANGSPVAINVTNWAFNTFSITSPVAIPNVRFVFLAKLG